MTNRDKVSSANKNLTILYEIIDKYPPTSESLIAILQDIQDEFQYISEDAVKIISAKLRLSIPHIYSVATFYKAFSLKPKGKNIIQVCTGTACHVRGALEIVEELERILKVKRGDTTDDLKFTLETVNCLGACALGPIVVVNGEYHGNMTPDRVKDIVKDLI